MLAMIFGEYTPQIMKAIQFVIGKPHKAMGFAYMLVVVNMFRAFIQTKKFFTPLVEYLEKAFAYTIFIILGNVLDNIMMDNMFEWKGSTQFLICLYIVIREIKLIRDYLTQRYGIDIPILNQRLNQMEQAQVNQDLTTRMENLRKELEALEKLKQNGEEPTSPEDPQ